MELSRYLKIFWRRKWIFLGTLLGTTVALLIGLSLLRPSYQATTTLRIATSTRGAADWVDYSIEYTDRMMNTLAQIAASDAMVDEVVRRLILPERPQIRVHIPANSELFLITVEHPDAVVAALSANIVAEQLIVQSQEFSSASVQQFQDVLGEQLEQMRVELGQAQQAFDGQASGPQQPAPIEAAGTALVQRWATYADLWELYERGRIRDAFHAIAITQIQPALPPAAPSGPNRTTYLLLGLLVGLLGSIGLVLLSENLDTTLYEPEEIRSVAELPLVGQIPRVQLPAGVAFMNGSSYEGEAFRRLRANITMLGSLSPLQTIMVVSAEPGEGKSTIAANLALTFSQLGQKTLLVDCDMRIPSLHSRFSLPNYEGLSNVLEHKSTLAHALQQSDETGVYLLASGPVSAKPAELLGSRQMVDLLEKLKQDFDRIILDTPALLAVADASLIAPLMDGVLLVIEAGQSREEAVQAAQQQLKMIQANVVGIVVNRAPAHYRSYTRYFEETVLD
jgi:capsular exopolysaccharide synthesis family protein